MSLNFETISYFLKIKSYKGSFTSHSADNVITNILDARLRDEMVKNLKGRYHFFLKARILKKDLAY